MADRITILGARESILPFRLAGVTSRVPAPGATVDALQAAAANGSELVMLAPDCAGDIPAESLAAARRRGQPLILVLPGDPDSRFDIRPEVRRALGLDP